MAYVVSQAHAIKRFRPTRFSAYWGSNGMFTRWNKHEANL